MSQQEIPPWLREQLARFDQMQQSLQAVMMQKQQVELELAEIERATSELKKAPTDGVVYKAAGSLLIKVSRDDILKELEERRELATTRQTVLSKQEVRVKTSVQELQAKLNEAIKGKGPAANN